MKNQTLVFFVILTTCLCMSACSSQIVSSYYDPATQPTATPGEKISDIPQIVEVLNQLAEKNVSMYQMEGWWLRNNGVVSQSGDLYSSDHEEWSYLPQDPSKCLVRMDISKDPNSGVIMLWQMQTQEGYMGELISLRQGTSEVMQVDLTACRLTEATTEAGYLAQSLQGDASGKDSRRVLEWANAWYEEKDGKPVFLVQAAFQTPFEKLSSQTERYTFDLQSGMVIDHYLRMNWQDGSQMGEFEVQSLYELWEELPEEVAAQYEQASKELKTYINVTPNVPSEGSTPEPTTQPVDLESMMEPYTKEKPLTDETQALAMVQEIMRRRTAWIAKPGWLLQKDTRLGGKDYTHEQYILVHITGDKGECQEQMVYFYKEGVISPWIVRLADGTSGNLYALKQSADTQGQIKENTFCSLKNGESVFFEGDFLLVDEANVLRNFIANKQKGLIKGDVEAWVEELDNLPVFVLAYRNESDPVDSGMVMNPTTQELERFTQNDKLYYFDLETGTPVWKVESYILQSGFATDFGEGMRYSRKRYDELPQELALAFSIAAEELIAHLSKVEANPIKP